ncbi:hypothetical protein HDU92_007376 [Lobulomyces angularis]|nr:hypothetical protein HDU92_007376 [Lobulomyces angularis]
MSKQGTEKVLTKLKAAVDQKNFYEAHQMYHSLCQRYVKQANYKAAVDLLHSGILTLLNADQNGSAFDLSQRLLEIFDQQKFPVTEENKEILIEIFEFFSNDSNSKKDFAKLCIKWSSKYGKNKNGDPQLNHIFGNAFYSEGEFYLAEEFFVNGTDQSAKSFGKMLYFWSKQVEEVDLGYFVARGVLQYLALFKTNQAHQLYEIFIKEIQNNENLEELTLTSLSFDSKVNINEKSLTLFKSPLLNFTKFLLLCVERGEICMPSFIKINNEYKQNLTLYNEDAMKEEEKEDRFLNQLMSCVGENYFGLKVSKPVNPLQNMFNSLFSSPNSEAIESNESMEMD